MRSGLIIHLFVSLCNFAWLVFKNTPSFPSCPFFFESGHNPQFLIMGTAGGAKLVIDFYLARNFLAWHDD
jgi:hypothetical protein